MLYAGDRLIKLLENQHQARKQSGLLKKGTFTLEWRTKVGSFPHPDVETIVSAGEPAGRWEHNNTQKLNIGDNFQKFPQLPLNGYIPGSCIRGIVRSWAKKRRDIKSRMYEILGYQEDDTISAGKIEFLDAWPETPTKLSLDIVNPQQDFQVFHQGQSTPLSSYTLGNGDETVKLTIAIRGIPGRATEQEVEEVWTWVEQALSLYGVGSRTASGYGHIKSNSQITPTPDLGNSIKIFDFTLFSQGSAGVSTNKIELRPSHWRGWLRSWVLRFLLGVMTRDDAHKTLGELLGSIEPETHQGKVRLRMIKSQTWGKVSDNQPKFYTWKGKLEIIAPTDILNQIILPIIKIAASVGGVGRGWRRPLHIFKMNNDRSAARGTYLNLSHTINDESTGQSKSVLYDDLSPENQNVWIQTYEMWVTDITNTWENRINIGYNNHLVAEVFSPFTCAIYSVAGPVKEPINRNSFTWEITKPTDTRGDGMNLIYRPEYKRKIDVGGNAAGGGNSHCSWVSIKRVKVPHKKTGTDCQEIICIFMGGQQENNQHLRSKFLHELAQLSGSTYLFGLNQ